MSWTWLHYAAGDDNLEVIKLLVARGADLSAADCKGWTALHVAVDNGLCTQGKDIPFATELPIAQTPIELGADETVKEANGETPRDVAAAYHQSDLYDSISRRRIS